MIKTFNNLVDECIEESNRPDFKTQIISLAYSIINKIHSIGEWRRDYAEAEFFRETAPSNIDDYKAFSFELPPRFRKIRALVAVTSDSREAYLPEIYPSIGQRDALEYYYQYRNNLMCYCYAGIESIKLAYYNQCNTFIYYEAGNNPPAKYDNALGKWSFLLNGKYEASLDSPEAEQAAMDSVTDWLITNYFDMVKNGILNRIFSVLGDERYKIAYSTYNDLYNNVFVPNESLLGAYGVNQ